MRENLEVFYVDDAMVADENMSYEQTGWYWWFCFPGCLPESDAYGPFESEQEAIEDAEAYDEN